MKKILVIGGGASGMMAAITAARCRANVTIYERNERVGKKILATGNGKCNLTNVKMGPEFYYTNDPFKLSGYLERFSATDTMDFFEDLGLFLRQRDGYVYPYCEQASVVLDILRLALDNEGVVQNTMVTNIKIVQENDSGFVVYSSLGKENFDAIILACGSKAGIKKADDTGYEYAKTFGHRICKLYPALVQVRCQESFFKSLAGVRCKAGITLYSDNRPVAFEQGEIQLTDYGISGIPVFQISRMIAGLIEEEKKLSISIDFLPHIRMDHWMNACDDRIKQQQNMSTDDFLLGILHKKISTMLLKEFGLKNTDSVNAKTTPQLRKLCRSMKDFRITPIGVNGFEQAQVCRGGVALNELDGNLQSIYQKNLYICGEMVDIDGKCGGYNLQWAWTSGHIAGEAASKYN